MTAIKKRGFCADEWCDYNLKGKCVFDEDDCWWDKKSDDPFEYVNEWAIVNGYA